MNERARRRLGILALAIGVGLLGGSAQLSAAAAALPVPQAGSVPTPGDVLGFELGADYELATYDQIEGYFRALADASDRVTLEEIGTSILGKPMLVALISTPENLARREQIREINRRMSHARGVSEEQARELAREGLATVWIDGGLHSTEVAHSLHTSELAYWLATDESEEARRIRDNVMVLVCPNINPDGITIVTEWYRKNLGTPFETAPLPELYHHYVGHDNNRDWYMFTQAESQNAANVFYKEWFPQIIYNHHQTGPFPGRIWVPPPADPLNGNFDPLIIASNSHIGQYMLARFMKEGKPGVSTSIGYRVAWSAGFMHAAPQLHNMLGMFTETALYTYATPHCYTDDEVGTMFSRGIQLPTREPSMHYIVPWEGGCWRIRHAMDYMMTGSRAVLDAASKLKEDYLFNSWHMGNRQIERGNRAEGGPFAYLLDVEEQHDPGAAVRLLRVFRQGGVEVHRAEDAFDAGGQRFMAGTYVIGPQAYRPFVVDLMESKQYPDRFLFPGGPPEQPYDLTGYNLPDQLGVAFHRIDEPFEMPGPAIDEIPPAQGGLFRAQRGVMGETPLIDDPGRTGAETTGTWGYLLSHDSNDAVIATNRLLGEGVDVAWAGDSFEAGGSEWPAGTILVRNVDAQRLIRLGRELGLKFRVLRDAPSVPLWALGTPRIGIYQSYTANMAEGWTRWVLESHEFDVEVLHNEDIREGDLSRFHIILLPDQGADSILNGHPPLRMPEGYTGGVGAEGAARLQEYVESGGWVMAFHEAVEFATRMFNLPVRNTVANADGRSFYVPGSLIRFEPDNTDPLAFGMADQGSALFWRHGLVMDVVPAAAEASSAEGEQIIKRDVAIYARFPEQDILADGWAIGADRYLAGRPAAIRVPLGRGQVILIGFRPDTRGQPGNAFKLLFNPLYARTIGPGELFR